MSLQAQAAAFRAQMPHDDLGPGLNAMTITMMVLSIIAVALRFWSRFIVTSGKKFWHDDWLALVGLAFSLGVFALIISAVRQGLGQHLVMLPPQNVVSVMKHLYAGNIIFDFAICFPKISALLFYMRVFFLSRAMRFSIWFLLVFIILGILFRVPASIWACVPPKKFWELELPGRCLNDLNSPAMYLVTGIWDCLPDLTLLLLPLPQLWQLQMAPLKKILLTITIICGYAVFFVSIGRVAATAKQEQTLKDDITYTYVTIVKWAVAELAIAVISICLPSWISMVNRASQHGLTSLFTTNPQSKPWSHRHLAAQHAARSSEQKQHSQQPLKDKSKMTSSMMSSGSPLTPVLELRNVPLSTWGSYTDSRVDPAESV